MKAGLGGLAGFNVTGVKINLAAPAGEPNLSGFAFIPNPSLMTIAMVLLLSFSLSPSVTRAVTHSGLRET